MTQNIWQKSLKLTYPKDVIDIVLFGSTIFDSDTAKDIDIAVIYEKIPLKEQLEHSQKIKNQLKKIFGKKIHMTSFDLYSLLDSGNFAREGILFYGKSLITKENFSVRFGIIPRLRIKYDLKDLQKKDKVRFNYLLSGRLGSYGLLRKYGGRIISPGVVEIMPEHEKIFSQKMKKLIKNPLLEKIFISKDSLKNQ